MGENQFGSTEDLQFATARSLVGVDVEGMEGARGQEGAGKTWGTLGEACAQRLPLGPTWRVESVDSTPSVWESDSPRSMEGVAMPLDAASQQCLAGEFDLLVSLGPPTLPEGRQGGAGAARVSGMGAVVATWAAAAAASRQLHGNQPDGAEAQGGCEKEAGLAEWQQASVAE